MLHSTSMKVALLLNGRYPTEKAYGIQIEAMARGFVEAGAEVALIYPRRTRVQPTPQEGITYLPFGPYSPLIIPGLFSLYRFLWMPFCAKALRTFHPDLVLANDPVQAFLFSKSWNVLWDLHDVPLLQTSLRKAFFRRLLRQVRGIVSTNWLKLHALQQRVSDLPPSLVVPNPVTLSMEALQGLSREEARRTLGLTTTDHLVMYIGQLFDWKGVDTVIEATKQLSKIPLQFHIIGGLGEDLTRTKALAQSGQSASGMIQFHGQRPHAEVIAWLRAADTIVIPNSGKFSISREDTNPMKLYESMAANAFILASDLPSLREAAEGYPFIQFIPADDIAAWSRALQAGVGRAHADLSEQNSAVLLTPKQRAERILEWYQEKTR